jgi:hypothetical protein
LLRAVNNIKTLPLHPKSIFWSEASAGAFRSMIWPIREALQGKCP